MAGLENVTCLTCINETDWLKIFKSRYLQKIHVPSEMMEPWTAELQKNQKMLYVSLLFIEKAYEIIFAYWE